MLKLKGPSMGISGRFKLDVLNSKGKLVEDKCLPEQKNLVTESGLSQFLSNNSTSFRLALGTGSTPPQREDVMLDNFLTYSPDAYGTSFTGLGYVTRIDSTSYESTREFVFDLGQVVGNITELGLVYGFGYNETPTLVTRALIKDALGNATSIELLEDEQLRVTYTLQMKISDSSEPYTLSVNNDGTLEEHTVTPFFAWRDLDYNYGFFVGRNVNYLHQAICTSLASDRSISSTGDSGNVGNGSFSEDRKTYSIEFEVYAGINKWNGETAWVGVLDHMRPGKVGSFSYNSSTGSYSTGSTTFIWQIDPPITKTNDQVMEITCSLSVTYGD